MAIDVPDLGDGGAADGAVGEEAEVEHGRRACGARASTNATPATTAPRIDASVIAESQPCSTPLVSE